MPVRKMGLFHPASLSIGVGATIPGIIKLLIFFIFILLLLSCTKAGEEEASRAVKPQKTGIYKIELSPAYATKNSAITVKVKGANPLDTSYQWIVNDMAVEGATEKVFKYPGLKKNDRVKVKVSVKDKGEMVSESLVISNITPHIQFAKLVPKNSRIGDELKVESKESDRDGDRVSLLYEWFINGEPAGGTDDVINIDGETIKRGDKVSVKLTPTDGEQKGQAVTLYSIVTNSPPTVLPDTKARFEGNIFTSQVMAEDPDGDNLTYTLQKGPEGMKIDSESGVITWEVTPKDEGEHSIVVSVNDGHGGEVLVPITTEITFVSQK